MVSRSRSARVWLRLTAMLAGAGLVLAFAATTAAAPATQTLSIFDDYYQSSSIAVQAGDTVVWRNAGESPHTVTADSGAFDSDILRSGQSWQFTFSSPGTYAYHCEVHGRRQAGTIVVQAAAAPASPAQPEPSQPAPDPVAVPIDPVAPDEAPAPVDSVAPDVAPAPVDPAAPNVAPAPADPAAPGVAPAHTGPGLPGAAPAQASSGTSRGSDTTAGAAPAQGGGPPQVPAAGFGPLAGEGPNSALGWTLSVLGGAMLVAAVGALALQLRRA